VKDIDLKDEEIQYSVKDIDLKDEEIDPEEKNQHSVDPKDEEKIQYSVVLYFSRLYCIYLNHSRRRYKIGCRYCHI
jgi:hypothetical protein